MKNFTLGAMYRFTWNDYELTAEFVGAQDDKPLFRESQSGLMFDLEQCGHVQVEAVNEAADFLKNYKPNLEKFGPHFMGLRTRGV